MKIEIVPVAKKHVKDLNRIANDPDVCRYLSITPPVSLRSTMQLYMGSKKAKNFWWAILCDGVVAGSVSLDRKGGPQMLKKMGHIVHLGIAIDKPFWSMGLGRKAIMYARARARKEGFKRLELAYFEGNEKAGRLYERCGFKEEGRLKRCVKLGGKYCDAIMMSQWLG